MKKITFRQNGKLVDIDVDITRLTPLARVLAQSVLTTDNSDDLSRITMYCKFTNAELYKKVVSEYESDGAHGKYGYHEYMNSKEQLDIIDNYGDPFDCKKFVQSVHYIWDSLRTGETGEEYFDRHAGYILGEKHPYLRDIDIDRLIREYKKFSDSIHDYLAASGMTQKSFAEALGIPLRTLESYLAGVRTPAPFTQTALLEAAEKIVKES